MKRANNGWKKKTRYTSDDFYQFMKRNPNRRYTAMELAHISGQSARNVLIHFKQLDHQGRMEIAEEASSDEFDAWEVAA